MTITPEEIARLRALEAMATPGPWEAIDQSYRMRVYEVFAGGTSVCNVTCCEDGMDEKDCNLIAESRNALPRLLDDVERLHAYDRALSAVMPADFKDWHQNNPREWPEVAAHVVENLRKREADACVEIERLRADLREATALPASGGSGGEGAATGSARDCP